MVTLVHDSGWVDQPTWPGTVRDGDLAILARSWSQLGGGRGERTEPGAQWRSLGTYGSKSGTETWRATAFYWTVQAGALASIAPASYLTLFRLLVFRNTQGIGRERTSTAMVPVQEGGGAFAIGRNPTSGGDLTVLPGVGRGSVGVAWGASWAGGTIGNPGWDDRYTRIYELLPPRGPQSPVVLTPGDGDEVSGTGVVHAAWQYRPVVPGGRQDAYQVRAWDASEDPLFWSASTGQWVTSEVTNESAVEGVDWPPDALTLGVPMWWQVRAREAVDGRWSTWSPVRTFTPVIPPTVEIDGPDAFHDDLSPLVSWSASTPRGRQTAFRVQIVHFGSVVYDSGTQPGDGGEWLVEPLEWVQGGTYQRRVQVQQTGGSWSSWATRDFTISWTEPAVPAVDVWPTDDGVLVRVVADPGLAVDLERITSEGLWERVDSFTMPGDGAATVTDVRAPLGRVTAYRARAVNELDGQRLVSGWGLSGQVANRSRWSYLFAAAAPLTTWVRCYIRDDGPRTMQRPTAVAHGLGDTYPRVSYGPRRGATAAFVLTAHTPQERAHLDRLLHAGEPLGLRLPGEEGQAPGVRDGGEVIFDVAGEVTVARVATGPFQQRLFTVPWVEQEPPVPGSGSNAPVTHPIGGPPGAAAQADNELGLEAF